MKRIYLCTLRGTVVAALCLAGTVQAASDTGTMEKKISPGTATTERGKLDQKDQDFLKKSGGNQRDRN